MAAWIDDEPAPEARIVTVAEIMASEWPLSLAADFEGACPCCHIVGDVFTVDVHCWRTGWQCDCEYSGIHVRGLPAELGQRVAEHVRDNNGWTNHTDWNITVEPQEAQSGERDG